MERSFTGNESDSASFTPMQKQFVRVPDEILEEFEKFCEEHEIKMKRIGHRFQKRMNGVAIATVKGFAEKIEKKFDLKAGVAKSNDEIDIFHVPRDQVDDFKAFCEEEGIEMPKKPQRAIKPRVHRTAVVYAHGFEEKVQKQFDDLHVKPSRHEGFDESRVPVDQKEEFLAFLEKNKIELYKAPARVPMCRFFVKSGSAEKIEKKFGVKPIEAGGKEGYDFVKLPLEQKEEFAAFCTKEKLQSEDVVYKPTFKVLIPLDAQEKVQEKFADVEMQKKQDCVRAIFPAAMRHDVIQFLRDEKIKRVPRRK